VTAALRRRIVVLFAGLAVALLPWLGVLNAVLPKRHLVTHWPLAWVGFDVALAAAFAAVALGARRRAPWLGAAATVAGTLLLADGWFDVATSAAGRALTVALGQALLMEVPLALLAFGIARREARALAGRRAAEAPAPSLQGAATVPADGTREAA